MWRCALLDDGTKEMADFLPDRFDVRMYFPVQCAPVCIMAVMSEQ